ncbi:hypothetical protein I3842_13G064600 [Carya illinoinensis]|uniref:EngB-type G domain-containing protein n=1 Tax=Carya illinoinensis TaxID=32201 RepID=A0A922AMC0_CARIL|nr:hypothetical protein I3842_13G064600 [Carya illinoinensis]KAG6680881.1 hypothetical protein I3842_13G064600 [Carya illinoinensis]KAG6680882.1 hypothetical protein I3842_13G064600 [Carya illinoinensis]KAG6680883.1 hypothetical protein I3842_13G064600 [Carya illinoinensis]KAG6680884.1 hypothetical protein I3842_13G064600 [Carya illinoinensis]
MSGESNLRYRLNKRLKLASGRSKNSKDENRKVESTLSNDGKGKLKPMSFDRKTKRIYAEHGGTNEEVTSSGNAKAPNRKISFKKGQNQVKDDVKAQTNKKKSPRSIWVSSKIENSTTETKQSYRKLKDAAERARASNRTNAKEVDEMDVGGTGLLKTRSKGKLKDTVDSAWASNRTKTKGVDEFDVGGTGSLKKPSKIKSDKMKRLDQCQEKSPYVSISKSAKKNVRGRRALDDDSEVLDDQPKRKKRVFRIDRHDTSNKRLDDGIVINKSTKEKEKDLEKKNEMSRNAQFRAIQPSPSILTYVEDNLLGRRRLIELRRAGYNIELSAPLDNIPFSTSSERERIEDSAFRNKLTFFAAAKSSSSFPPPELPEIAFAGRSNVGKSSLLNALTRQWGIVRTSDKPGLTQTINFFNLGSKLCLVDLPGYGFAYAKEEVKDAWEELVKEYVSTRVGLKRVCLLVDTKWGMKPRDHELINLMERSQTKYQIVLTKTDMIFPIDVARHAMQIEESLKANKSVVQPLMMVSSKSGAGIRSLRTVLSKIARFVKP